MLGKQSTQLYTQPIHTYTHTHHFLLKTKISQCISTSLNSRCSCFGLPSAGIKDMHHHDRAITDISKRSRYNDTVTLEEQTSPFTVWRGQQERCGGHTSSSLSSEPGKLTNKASSEETRSYHSPSRHGVSGERVRTHHNSPVLWPPLMSLTVKTERVQCARIRGHDGSRIFLGVMIHNDCF